MKPFIVIARTAAGDQPITCIAMSSAEAAEQVAGYFDEPCGITVRNGGDHGNR
jgi:hypothetical protein